MICLVCQNKLILLQKKEYIFFKCNNCKSIYKGFSCLKNFISNSEEYNTITNEEYFDNNVKAFLSNPIMDITRKYINNKSKLLDIGCSNGAFLEALKRYQMDDVYGIDIQKDTVQFAKTKKLNCYYGSFPNELPLELDKKYNIITSFENIYYMESLLDFFDKSFQLLEKNGKIILKFNQSSSSYYFNYPYHIRVGNFNNFISLETIHFLAIKYNFKILETIAFDNNHVTNYLGYSSWKTKPKKNISFFLRVVNKISKWIIPINYADKILVVLEKN